MSDGVFITRVHLPDSKNNHLISNIKQEPQDDSPEPISPRVSNETSDPCQTVGSAFSTATPLAMPAIGDHPLQLLQERPLRPKSHPTIPNQPSNRLPIPSPPISTNCFQFPALSRADPTAGPPVPLAPMLHTSLRSTVPTLSSLTPIFISAGMTQSQITEQQQQQHELRSRGLIPTLVNSAGISAPSSIYGFSPTQAYFTHPAVSRHPFSSIPNSMPRVSVLNNLPTSTCISTTLPMTGHSQTSKATPQQAPPASKLRTIRPNRYDVPPISTHSSRGPSPVFPKLSTPQSAPILGLHQQQQIVNSLSSVPLDSPTCPSEARSRMVTTSPEQMSPAPNATSTTATTTSISQIVSVNTTTASTNTVPSAATTTSSSSTTPDPDGLDTLASGPVAWGRVVRMADGSLHFPGIGRQFFSNSQSVLERIRAAASSDDSFYLQLPPNSIDFDVPMEARTNNLMKLTSTDCGSRKGFHVCLCCKQTFTSPSLYDSHMLRPLARIFYRCHICRGSETAHLISLDENQGNDLHTATSDSVDVSVSTASGLSNGGGSSVFTSGSPQQLPSHSPYCTVLFGGIVKAFNRCAVYSHFAYAHPNEVDLWKLQPSRVSVCPLSESAWDSIPIELLGADPLIATCISGIHSTRSALPPPQSTETDPTRQHASPPSTPTGTPEPTVINEVVSDDEGTTHPANKLLNTAGSYRPGTELLEVWNDLEQAINEATLHHGFKFLNSSDRFIDLSGVSSTLTASSSLAFDATHSTVANSTALQRIYASTSDSSSITSEPSLPLPTSSLVETILHLARAPVWYSHLFLTDWSQKHHLTAKPSSEPEQSKSDQLTIDQDHRSPQQPTEEKGVASVKRMENKSNTRPIVPPPVPSNSELNDILLNLVHSSRCSTPHTSDQTTTARASSEQPTTSESASDPTCTKSTSSHPSDVADRGFIRCLLCPFQTNHPDRLVQHLTGSRNNVPTKCALCAQSVRIQQPALCAAKAHLLLHLGYYIMCPNCGFTPPPHLAPDAAELCLRVHLRFVCFHFNLLQVFVCSRCQHGRGKAYNTMAHLCQHIYDSHTQRLYLCLWCARQDSTVRSAGDLNNTDNNTEAAPTAPTRSSDPVEHNGVDMESSQTYVNGSSVSPNRSASVFFTPKELLTHLRQGHKHALILPPAEYFNTGHDTVDQTPAGLSHGKHAQQPLMRNGYSSEQTVDTTNEEIRNGPSSAGTKSHVPMVDSTVADKASNQLIHLVPSVDFLYVHRCPDCDEVFEHREAFAQHFRVSHYSNCSGVCCYRCFGSCKRLSFDLAEFHEHLVTCPSARDLFVATFAPGRTATARSTSHPDHHPNANEGTSLRGPHHPLCFCLHCGIGARRLGPQPRISGEDESCVAKGSTTASVDDGSVSDQPPPPPQAMDTTANLSTALKEPLYDPRYFHDLHSVHNHEAQFHYTPTNSQIACPWCGRRLSCNKAEDIRFTMHHLKSHMKRHAFASWSLDRTIKWNRNAKALSHCICGAALLDSPLAVLSHASSHLLVSRPGQLTSALPNRLFVAEGGSPHLIRLPSASSDVGSTSDRPSAPTNNTAFTLRRLQRPSPGAHFPCMTDVYHHLRFAVAPELDHYLDHASLVSEPFVCPLCSVRVSTRWALSEHAFVEHWGHLCFICCLVPSSDSRIDLGKKRSSQQMDDRPPTEQPLPAFASVPELPDPPTPSPATTAVTCPASTSPVLPSTETGVTKSIVAPNIWEHIYQCMSERSRLLQAGQHGTEHESTRVRRTAASSGSDEGGAVWSRRNPRQKRSSGQSDSSTKTFKRCCDDALRRIDRTDPIVIVSSPELSPRSERASVTADESDNTTTGSQPAKRSRRLVIVDEDGEDELGDKRSAAGQVNNDHASSNQAELTNGDRTTSSSPTSSTQHLELNDVGFTEEPSSLLCVICGEEQTLDTWEDHSLSHRNPQMPWNGVQLSDPRRLVLTNRQPKVYKCYVCDRRFVTRFGCQRHMTGRHKMAKSRISWDLLIQSSGSGQGTKSPERPYATVARKSSMSNAVRHRDQPPPPLPPPPYPKSSVCCSTTPSIVDNSSGSLDFSASRSSDHPVEGAPSEPQQQLHYCTVCRIPFMSQLSFSIHKAAAHGNS